MNQIISAYSSITPAGIQVNGRPLQIEKNFTTFAALIKPFYKRLNLGYSKFYKMDSLSKLGFIAAELVVNEVNLDLYHRENIGVVLANAASSLDTDLEHQQTINDRNSYYPSPSVFVYTLPNIMIGEICIRHRLKGENTWLISEKFSSRILFQYVHELFQQNRVEACFTGWVDLLKDRFTALMMFIEPAPQNLPVTPTGLPLPFSENTMDELYYLTCEGNYGRVN